MVKTYRGSCHCGAVRFEADLGLSQGTVRCNCSLCAKMRFWTALVWPASFRLLSGQDALTSYQFHRKVERPPFCRDCRVRPFSMGNSPRRGPFYAVSVSCLDGAAPDELAGAPIADVDGRNDNADLPPAAVRHLSASPSASALAIGPGGLKPAQAAPTAGRRAEVQPGAVARSSRPIQRIASSRFVPHISADGCKPAHTAGRSGRPKIRQRWSSASCAQRTPAGLPCGIPGIGLEIDGAVQQAPQPGRQSGGVGGMDISGDTRVAGGGRVGRQQKRQGYAKCPVGATGPLRPSPGAGAFHAQDNFFIDNLSAARLQSGRAPRHSRLPAGSETSTRPRVRPFSSDIEVAPGGLAARIAAVAPWRADALNCALPAVWVAAFKRSFPPHCRLSQFPAGHFLSR